MCPELIKFIRKDTYVDDIVSGVNILSEFEVIKKKKKKKSIELFPKGGFSLHRWHLNISLLENSDSNNNDELTYAKQ